MKILIITRSFVREVSDLVRYAARKKLPLEFSVVMPYGTHIEKPLPAHVSFRKLYFIDRMRATCYTPSIFADICSFQPDVLHIFEEFSGLIAFQSLLLNTLLRRKSKVMMYSAENLPNNIRAVLKFPMRYVMKRADVAFVCSHGVKTVLEAEGYTNSIEVFPLGVDTTKFYKFSANDVKDELQLHGKFVVGYVGRLLEIKGVYLLIELMQHLPDSFHAVFVGNGPEEHNLRKLAAQYHVSQRVHFVGNVPYTRLPHYINCMDIGIVPSRTTKRWKEQFGRVLVEFMSCEVPVIGSTSGSIPEVLGTAGCLFSEDNIQQLVQKIHDLSKTPEILQELGKKGRARVIANYSTEIMCNRLLSMYTNLVPH